MELLIIANIVVILINIGILLYLFIEITRLKQTFKQNFKMIEESFNARILELSEAMKFLTKLNLSKLKNKDEKSKIVPFKPEDLDKIKEQLNVSSH
jgi:predicted Holliday junction resolvase-like endonuclease